MKEHTINKNHLRLFLDSVYEITGSKVALDELTEIIDIFNNQLPQNRETTMWSCSIDSESDLGPLTLRVLFTKSKSSLKKKKAMLELQLVDTRSAVRGVEPHKVLQFIISSQNERFLCMNGFKLDFDGEKSQINPGQLDSEVKRYFLDNFTAIGMRDRAMNLSEITQSNPQSYQAHQIAQKVFRQSLA